MEEVYKITSNNKKLYASQIKASRKWDKAHYGMIAIRIRKDEIDEIKERIKATGMSLNSFVLGAILEKLEKMGY